ncbi:hypothetical protein [Sphaerisporangium rubeum]|uniref:Uncharacterized protein n=1 Tax=Sphaerisporangium rubeum TaxID=321317 RepID=A0A7X0IKR4_9ACTN|nr:hypothetical protein [Sphaerisporangium rubeum]MBB6475482.1 hypothetical protein [Sphaerisporangium rubeum]
MSPLKDDHGHLKPLRTQITRDSGPGAGVGHHPAHPSADQHVPHAAALTQHPPDHVQALGPAELDQQQIGPRPRGPRTVPRHHGRPHGPLAHKRRHGRLPRSPPDRLRYGGYDTSRQLRVKMYRVYLPKSPQGW